MKRLPYTLFLSALVALVVVTGCKDDDEPTPVQEVTITTSLSGIVGNVSWDGSNTEPDDTDLDIFLVAGEPETGYSYNNFPSGVVSADESSSGFEAIEFPVSEEDGVYTFYIMTYELQSGVAEVNWTLSLDEYSDEIIAASAKPKSSSELGSITGTIRRADLDEDLFDTSDAPMVAKVRVVKSGTTFTWTEIR